METDPIYGGTTSHNTGHQKWLSNVHNQVNDTPNLIDTQPVTQNKYLTKIANSIINENTGVAVEYILV